MNKMQEFIIIVFAWSVLGVAGYGFLTRTINGGVGSGGTGSLLDTGPKYERLEQELAQAYMIPEKLIWCVRRIENAPGKVDTVVREGSPRLWTEAKRLSKTTGHKPEELASAYGLMQILGTNAVKYGHEPADLKHRETNLELGSAMLSNCYHRNRGNLVLTGICWNGTRKYGIKLQKLMKETKGDYCI